MSARRGIASLAFGLLVAGCGQQLEPQPATDRAAADGGTASVPEPDAGAADGARPTVDQGAADAGDAGAPDAGDAGAPDAGDARVAVGGDECACIRDGG